MARSLAARSILGRPVKFIVSIRAAGEADISKARNWYEKQRPGLGDEFLLSVTSAIVHLEHFGNLYPPYYRDIHRVLLTRFPYKVFFRINGENVVIFRVLHTARDHGSELSNL